MQENEQYPFIPGSWYINSFTTAFDIIWVRPDNLCAQSSTAFLNDDFTSVLVTNSADGWRQNWAERTRSRKSLHITDLYLSAKSIVEDIKALCQQGEQIQMLLDRPNMHPLIDLYAGPMPQFEHALFLSDLLFESNHRALKSIWPTKLS